MRTQLAWIGVFALLVTGAMTAPRAEAMFLGSLKIKQFTKCKPGYKVVHPGTRSEKCVRVSSGKKCAPVRCRMYCRCGWAKGANGCPRCACARCGKRKCGKGLVFLRGKCRKPLKIKRRCRKGQRWVFGRCRTVHKRKCKPGQSWLFGRCRKASRPIGPVLRKFCRVGQRIHFSDKCKCPPGTKVKTLNRSYHVCERAGRPPILTPPRLPSRAKKCPRGSKLIQVRCIRAPCPARCVTIARRPPKRGGRALPGERASGRKPLRAPAWTKLKNQ